MLKDEHNLAPKNYGICSFIRVVIISETVEKVKYLGTLLPGTPYGRKIEKWNIRVVNA
jgi:hypothetical protein